MFAQIRKIQLENTSSSEKQKKFSDLVLPRPFSFLSSLSSSILIPLIWLISFFSSAAPVVFAKTDVQRLVFLAIAPVVFALCFIIVSGLISNLGRYGVVEGKFPRKSEHPIYALRKIYGAAWTQLYYFKPLYAVCLSIPALKKLMFRLFGFSGSIDITVFPDTWLRDLPLLNIGHGAYLANRATLGTNMCLNDGSIILGPKLQLERESYS